MYIYFDLFSYRQLFIKNASLVLYKTGNYPIHQVFNPFLITKFKKLVEHTGLKVNTQ